MEDITGQATTFHLNTMKPHDRIMLRRPFPPSYSEAMYSSGGPEVGGGAPPYSSIHQDPVISYPVATLGRLVLPAPGQEVVARARRRTEEDTSQPLPASSDSPSTPEEDLTQTTV